MKPVTFHLTETQLRELKRIKKDSGVNIAEQIRRAVDEYLKRKGSK